MLLSIKLRTFEKDESTKKHLNGTFHVYNLKVCVFFFANLKLLVQYFRQSVLLRQSFEFRWNNQTDVSFSLSRNFGYQVVLKLCYEHFVNLFLLSAAALNRAITVLHEWTVDEALHAPQKPYTK